MFETLKSQCAPIVKLPTADSKILPMDFTVENKALTLPLLKDTALFSAYVEATLKAENATFGIGGYMENRVIYQRSEVFSDSSEPRSLHLGVDIWGPAHTVVYAPLAGKVHSLGINPAYGDYGGTIILVHNINDVVFYTLYGHLSHKSIQNLQQNDTIEKGQTLAAFGDAEENGNWPPHLHFQLITDMLGRSSDFAGVCKPSEKDYYMELCPDANWLINL